MQLSDRDIINEIKKGNIKIDPRIKKDQIGPGSIDLTLDNEFWFIKKEFENKNKIIDLKKTNFSDVFEKVIANKIVLQPNQLCLGITKEKIMLSANIMGRLEGRSRYARLGLAVHVTSSLVQPGCYNRQVLEIVNVAPYSIKLYSGMRISQICLSYTLSPTSKPYKKFGKIAKDQ
ncbi:MAG: dCTP deaminase [Candidatus Micrarchaeota archaeon]|nr:dCTP deaminase [Candidatus Micrarchaeota archaeon]